MKISLRTPYGDRYIIDTESGNIAREGQSFSNAWKFVGLSHVKRNEIIPLKALTPERVRMMEFRYKNGNPQWTVRDTDHGTTREWGNTRVYGVAGMSYLDERS